MSRAASLRKVMHPARERPVHLPTAGLLADVIQLARTLAATPSHAIAIGRAPSSAIPIAAMNHVVVHPANSAKPGNEVGAASAKPTANVGTAKVSSKRLTASRDTLPLVTANPTASPPSPTAKPAITINRASHSQKFSLADSSRSP